MSDKEASEGLGDEETPESLARVLVQRIANVERAQERVEDWVCSMHDKHHLTYEQIGVLGGFAKSWAFKLARAGRKRRPK